MRQLTATRFYRNVAAIAKHTEYTESDATKEPFFVGERMRGGRVSERANGGGGAAIACKQFNGKGQRKVTKEGRKAERRNDGGREGGR